MFYFQKQNPILGMRKKKEINFSLSLASFSCASSPCLALGIHASDVLWTVKVLRYGWGGLMEMVEGGAVKRLEDASPLLIIISVRFCFFLVIKPTTLQRGCHKCFFHFFFSHLSSLKRDENRAFKEITLCSGSLGSGVDEERS